MGRSFEASKQVQAYQKAYEVFEYCRVKRVDVTRTSFGSLQSRFSSSALNWVRKRRKYRMKEKMKSILKGKRDKYRRWSKEDGISSRNL